MDTICGFSRTFSEKVFQNNAGNSFLQQAVDSDSRNYREFDSGQSLLGKTILMFPDGIDNSEGIVAVVWGKRRSMSRFGTTMAGFGRTRFSVTIREQSSWGNDEAMSRWWSEGDRVQHQVDLLARGSGTPFLVLDKFGYSQSDLSIRPDYTNRLNLFMDQYYLTNPSSHTRIRLDAQQIPIALAAPPPRTAVYDYFDIETGDVVITPQEGRGGGRRRRRWWNIGARRAAAAAARRSAELREIAEGVQHDVIQAGRSAAAARLLIQEGIAINAAPVGEIVDGNQELNNIPTADSIEHIHGI